MHSGQEAIEFLAAEAKKLTVWQVLIGRNTILLFGPLVVDSKVTKASVAIGNPVE